MWNTPSIRTRFKGGLPIMESTHDIDGTQDVRAVTFIHERLPEADVVHVFGELSFATRAEFEAVLVRSVRLGASLVVALGACSYLDAAAIGVLVRARRALGTGVRILAPESGIVANILRIANVA